ncbi:MAG: Tm-1-like ATP-binding domain-containing protein, partial [Geminicoccaceae bacterium]
VILTNQGIEEWDREGQEAHDPEGLAVFLEEMRAVVQEPVKLTELDCHINDQAFVDAALAIFDGWVADGTISSKPA